MLGLDDGGINTSLAFFPVISFGLLSSVLLLSPVVLSLSAAAPENPLGPRVTAGGALKGQLCTMRGAESGSDVLSVTCNRKQTGKRKKQLDPF